ncbi:MAG TPA: beta-carotene hydroxylase [Rhodobiaceae bacterium]|nr:beta-carotene hydroxylase [Rhodobiaceae bacterium]
MSKTIADYDVSGLSNAELTKMEREIARKYMDKLSIPMVLWPILNLSCWLALWPLVFTGIMPLWLGFIIATINTTLSYLPSHEAQHDIYARPGDKLRWLNEAIGHLSLIPLAFGYRFLRLTHLEHHKHTNSPELDPDHVFNEGGNIWQTIRLNIDSFQPNSKESESYAACLERLGSPEAKRAYVEQIFIFLTYMGILFACAAYGFALEALLLWWLPLKLATIYIRIYLSWLPHYPGHETGRYKDTRGFKSWLGVWSSLAMTAHIVHHLHPRIPLDKTPAALRELYPILEARKCDLLSREHAH